MNEARAVRAEKISLLQKLRADRVRSPVRYSRGCPVPRSDIPCPSGIYIISRTGSGTRRVARTVLSVCVMCSCVGGLRPDRRVGALRLVVSVVASWWWGC